MVLTATDKPCRTCAGRKKIGAEINGRMVLVPCEDCRAGGKQLQRVYREDSWPQNLDTTSPAKCPNCRMDINPTTDNFCWLCGIQLEKELPHMPTKLRYASRWATCSNCGSHSDKRLSRWGIFKYLPAWRWPWPIRIRLRYTFCHTCGKDGRILVIL